MAWGDWMNSKLPTEIEFRLRAAEIEMARAAHEAPEALAAMASMLHRQAAVYHQISQQAARRIAELECREALAEPGPNWAAIARELAPQAPADDEAVTKEQGLHFVQRMIRQIFS